MGLKREAINGVTWSAVQKWGVRLISFLVMLILARIVSIESFGLVAYAVVFTAFAQIFVDQGFSDAIVQFSNLEQEHLDTAFWVSLLTGGLLSLATLAASGLIASIFREPDLEPIIRWLSPIFVLSALSSVQQSILRRKLAFKQLSMRSLVATLASGIIAVAMALLGFGVWSLVAKLLVDASVNVIALWQVSDWRPSLRFSTKHFKELFSYGINIIGGNFVDYLSVHSDDFLIGYFLGAIPLGYYTLAYNLLIILTDLLVTVPNAVAFPVFSKIQADPERLKSAFFEVTQLQSVMAFPVFLGLFAVAPEAVRVLCGDKWIPSIPVLQVLMLMGIVRSATYFYSSIFRAAGKPSWRFGIYTLTAVLNVTGFLLVVRMGIVAVAVSYVVVSYLLMPFYFLLIRKLVQVTTRAHLSQYVPALISSLIMVAVVYALRYALGESVSLLLRFILLILAGGVTYLFAIRVVHPPLYTKMLELAQIALPKSLLRKS
jgi:O-antigen/teichoic acid export membrane protein